VLSFLIKETENNALLTKSDAKTKFEISDAQGSGFKMGEYFDKYKFDFPTTTVIMLACGSGIGENFIVIICRT